MYCYNKNITVADFKRHPNSEVDGRVCNVEKSIEIRILTYSCSHISFNHIIYENRNKIRELWNIFTLCLSPAN